MRRDVKVIALLVVAILLCSGCSQGGAAGHARGQSWAADGARGSSSGRTDSTETPTAVNAGHSSTVTVDVSGAVRRPGVYQLATRSRVLDVIAAAGGGTADADYASLNRAATIVDGQQIVVASRGAQAPSETGGAVAAAGSLPSTAKVSLNAADAAALEQLPGIGPVTAAAIVADRTEHGPFSSVNDLDRVQGIGSATIDALRDAVTV